MLSIRIQFKEGECVNNTLAHISRLYITLLCLRLFSGLHTYNTYRLQAELQSRRRKKNNFSLENVKLDFTVIIIANVRLGIMLKLAMCLYGYSNQTMGFEGWRSFKSVYLAAT
jgi:hypothetical protein